jgi:aspartate/methionine/tyrosine aminotransferase
LFIFPGREPGDFYKVTDRPTIPIPLVQYFILNSFKKSVLIIPGDDFGIDKYLRILFSSPTDYLGAGLDRIHELFFVLV